MAESLRLAVEVDDKFSEQLKKLHQGLASVGNREHMGRLKDLGEGFKHAREAALGFSESLKKTLEPSFEALGIGALSVGGGMAAIIEGSRHAGEALAGLGRVSATLRVSPQFVKDQESLFKAFGIGAAETDQALKSFAASYRDLQHGIGELHNTLADYDPKEDATLRAMKSYPQAVAEFERYLNTIKDPIKRARLSALGFGSEDEQLFGTVTRKQFATIEEETRAGSEKVSQAAIDAGKEYEEAQNKLSRQINTEWNVTATAVLPIMSEMTTSVTNFIKANETEIKGGLVDFLHALEQVDWKGLGEGMKTMVDDANGLASALNSITAFQNQDAKATRDRLHLKPDPQIDFAKLPKESWSTWFGSLWGGHHSTSAGPFGALVNPFADHGDAQLRAPALSGPLTERGLSDAVRKGVKEGIKDSKNEDLPVAGGAEDALEMEPNRGDGFYQPGGGLDRARKVHRGGLGRRPGAGGDGGGEDYSSPIGAGNLTKLITEAANRAGIDPRIMEGIRAGESGHGSRYDRNVSAIESSWGPFQLNRKNGLGIDFERDTAGARKSLGLGDLRDPRTIALQAQWVANYVKKHGGTNGQWMGYHGKRDADSRWGDSGYVPAPAARTGAVDRAIGGAFTGPGMLGANMKGGVTIDLHATPAAPAGMSIGAEGLFKQTKINRGVNMPSASWDG